MGGPIAMPRIEGGRQSLACLCGIPQSSPQRLRVVVVIVGRRVVAGRRPGISTRRWRGGDDRKEG